jgi:hypothetical protein
VKPSERDNSENGPLGRAQSASEARLICTPLPPVATINGARIRALTDDNTIPDTPQVILQAFRAMVGERTFHVGFFLGNESGFSAVGIAVPRAPDDGST